MTLCINFINFDWAFCQGIFFYLHENKRKGELLLERDKNSFSHDKQKARGTVIKFTLPYHSNKGKKVAHAVMTI